MSATLTDNGAEPSNTAVFVRYLVSFVVSDCLYIPTVLGAGGRKFESCRPDH